MNSLVKEKLRKLNIIKIYPDGSVDVNGNVDLSGLELTKIPIKLNKVSGNFDCFDNKLTRLEGCPKYVGDSFNCFNNQLISLEGCPKEVGGYFCCEDNKVKFTKEQVREICNVRGGIIVK